MNPFAMMQNDEVTVFSIDGGASAKYMTHIGTKGKDHVATIYDEGFIGEEGWLLSRTLPGGREERYLIKAAHFSPGHSAIPAHWSLTLAKGTSMAQMQEDTRAKQAPVININNSQGIQIGDNNVQHIASSLQGLIEKIDQSSATVEEKSEARGLVSRLLSNPTVAGVLGAAASGVIAALSK